MNYTSTRGNYTKSSSAEAINLGMVPEGGLFVPETLPRLACGAFAGLSYQDTAKSVLAPLLGDFSAGELGRCVDGAYNETNFDIAPVIRVVPLDKNKSVVELWHGPTAAFKDMALQIMPHFLEISKVKMGEKAHTVILVATSGDTGKAALEGFKNREGISIVVFYPHGGVSEIQRLQMATTEGFNTHVVAVRGNFDDCQTGVKRCFSDRRLRGDIGRAGFVFSSANSINWGRLCPQIVYYFRAYAMLVESGTVRSGETIDISVPTGNFGNILAAYYAKEMGLPVNRLLCASNRNRILADFFTTGEYNRNREFFRTVSPSMDILISSNLERFLFEMTGHDSPQVRRWYESLAAGGAFRVDPATKKRMDGLVVPGWADEPGVLSTIREVFNQTGYVLDTHTAVGVAVAAEAHHEGVHTLVASTASPYKFSTSVLEGLCGERSRDEFESIDRVASLWGTPVHRALAGLRAKPVRHTKVIDINDMETAVVDIIGSLRK